MSMVTSVSSNVKFDVVKGDLAKTYDRFFSLFLAQANAKGYGGVVTGKDRVLTAAEVVDDVTQKLDDLNTKAFSALVTACSDDSRAFGIVEDTKDGDYPNGNVQLALDELRTEFTESTLITKRKMEKAFLRTKKYKKKNNPVKELEKLLTLRRSLKKHNVEKSLADCFEVVLRRLPKEYRSVKKFLKCRLVEGNLTYENVAQQLTMRFDELEEGEDSSEDESTESEASQKTEKAVLAVDNKMCSLCGKWGHTRDRCFEDPKNAHLLEAYLQQRERNRSQLRSKYGGLHYGQGQGRGYHPGRLSNRGQRGPKLCHICKSPSHLARDCPVNRTVEAANVGEEEGSEIAFVCREEGLQGLLVAESEKNENEDMKHEYINEDYNDEHEFEWESSLSGNEDNEHFPFKKPSEGISIAKRMVVDNGESAGNPQYEAISTNNNGDLEFKLKGNITDDVGAEFKSYHNGQAVGEVLKSDDNGNLSNGKNEGSYDDATVTSDVVGTDNDDVGVNLAVKMKDFGQDVKSSDCLNYTVDLPTGDTVKIQINIMRTLTDISDLLIGEKRKRYTMWNNGEELEGELTMGRWKPGVCLSGADVSVVKTKKEEFFPITVKFLTNETIEVHMKKRETLFHLKEFINTIKGIPYDKQRYVWNRAVLVNDCLALVDYGIKPNDVLHMVQNYRGGAKTVKGYKRNINPPVYIDDASIITTYYDEDMNETYRPVKKRKWVVTSEHEAVTRNKAHLDAIEAQGVETHDDDGSFFSDCDDLDDHSDVTDLTNNSCVDFYFRLPETDDVRVTSIGESHRTKTKIFLRNRVGSDVKFKFDFEGKIPKSLTTHPMTSTNNKSGNPKEISFEKGNRKIISFETNTKNKQNDWNSIGNFMQNSKNSNNKCKKGINMIPEPKTEYIIKNGPKRETTYKLRHETGKSSEYTNYQKLSRKNKNQKNKNVHKINQNRKNMKDTNQTCYNNIYEQESMKNDSKKETSNLESMITELLGKLSSMKIDTSMTVPAKKRHFRDRMLHNKTKRNKKMVANTRKNQVKMEKFLDWQKCKEDKNNKTKFNYMQARKPSSTYRSVDRWMKQHGKKKNRYKYEYCGICGDEFKFEVDSDGEMKPNKCEDTTYCSNEVKPGMNNDSWTIREVSQEQNQTLDNNQCTFSNDTQRRFNNIIQSTFGRTQTGNVQNTFNRSQRYASVYDHEKCFMAQENPTYDAAIESDGVNIWVADTGATCHMGCVKLGMIDIKQSVNNIKVGNGEKLKGNTVRDLNVTYFDKTDNETHKVRLTNYAHTPDIKYNLYSIPYVMNQGAEVVMDDGFLKVKKDGCTIKFDMKLKSGSSYLMCARMVPVVDQYHELAMIQEDDKTKQETKGQIEDKIIEKDKEQNTDKLRPMTFIKAHQILGHAGPQLTISTAKTLGFKVKSSNKKCKHCGKAKSMQKNLKRSADDPAVEKGIRLMINITSSRELSLGGNKYWLAMMDEGTSMLWCEFLKKKSQNGERVMKHIMKMKGWGIDISKLTIRCDNAPENYTLKDMTDKKGLGIKYEFTARGTPQQNGKLERKLRTIWGRTKAMLNCANLKGKMRGKLWAECVRTATMIDVVLTKEGETGPYTKFFNQPPKYFSKPRTFGEMGILKKNKKMFSKLENKGQSCMFMGYSEDHSPDTYRLYVLATRRLVIARDVLWLNAKYNETETTRIDEPNINTNLWIDSEDEESQEKKKVTFAVSKPIVISQRSPTSKRKGPEQDHQAENGNDEDTENLDFNGDTNKDGPINNPDADHDKEEVTLDEIRHKRNRISKCLKELDTTYNPQPRVKRALKKLETNFNPHPKKQDELLHLTMEDEVCFVHVEDGEPLTFKQAWFHDNLEDRNKWRAAIMKEIKCMLGKGVWEDMTREKFDKLDPSDKIKRPIGCRWVFKIKRNGVYRARLVAQGYSQIKGIDYDENYSPVVKEICQRIIMCLILNNKDWKKTITDVETAFLYGELDRVLFMNSPPGYDIVKAEMGIRTESDSMFVKLKKTIYGLVQAARAWWQHLWSHLKEMKFEKCIKDGCLFRKVDKDGEVIICAYIDDMLIIGDKEAVDRTHAALSGPFTILVEEATEFLGCKWINTKDGYRIHQPHIIKKLERIFGEEVKDLKDYATPSGEAYRVNRVREGEPQLSPKEQTRYRSGIGIALYLSRYTRPDICNATRELSKGMTKANKAHYKQLLRLIKYILGTKNLVLKAELRHGVWTMVGKSDSDYAGDNDTRKSVTGYIIILNGLIICWRSKGQNIITLSSTEAEYICITDMSCDMLFIIHIMEFLGMKLKLPVDVETDNTGAMFLAENEYASQRTKHIDVRYHYIRQHIENKTMKISLIKSEDNTADIFTKNLGHKLFWTHVDKMMEWNEEEDNTVPKVTMDATTNVQEETILGDSTLSEKSMKINDTKENVHEDEIV